MRLTCLQLRIARFIPLLSVFLLTFGLILPATCQEPSWPKTITNSSGVLVCYQPQVDAWQNYQTLDLRMAFTITPAGQKKQVGVITATMQTSVNFDTHTVLLTDPQITSVVFPSLNSTEAAPLDSMVRTFVNPASTMNISLERLAASVKKPTTPPNMAAVDNTPPEIFVSIKPAILLLINGAPAMGAIESSNLQFVVNANWPLFQVQGGAYYLFNGKGWMTTTSLDGTFTATAQLPPEMSAVPANSNFTSLKQFIPPPPGSAAVSPMVYYSTKPAEIIVFNGVPQWTAIPGTQLSYASNTGSPVFKYAPTGQFYFLTSGRWFTASGPMAQWTFATYSLPADFKNIPPNNPASSVLSSVPGTPEAEDAVLIAQIPTTVTVNPANAASEVKVSYVGSPQFLPITGTTMYYATNTPNKVIQVGAQYYVCYQGLWFVGASPTGPWTTAQTVPQVIYTIPASSPVYNVTYVTQTTLPSGDVQASYTAGYMGAFVTGAAVGAIVACGTGYYYPPYVYHGYYYPYAATYGYHTYNPYTGAYGYGGSAYGPYGSAHWGTSYNPNTGTYARGAEENTAYGSRAQGEAYNPYTGASAATRQGSNAYGSWGQSVYSKNGNTAYTQHASDAYGSEGSVQTSKGGEAYGQSTAAGNSAVGKTSSGDMYADHNGNVYQNSGSGWQKYDNGSWNDVNKSTAQASAQSYQQSHPTSTTNSEYHPPSGSSSEYHPTSGSSDLDQEAENRSRGDYQSHNYSQAREEGGFSSAHQGGGWGGGGDRWGSGGRSFGGGFRR